MLLLVNFLINQILMNSVVMKFISRKQLMYIAIVLINFKLICEKMKNVLGNIHLSIIKLLLNKLPSYYLI